MTNETPAEIGIVGLGVMGANLALNMAGHGIPVAVHDADLVRVNALTHKGFCGCNNPETLVQAIRPPRPIMLLVPAGAPVDAVIGQLAPMLGSGDILIDAGNSDFHETRRRTAELEAKGLAFLGIGVSGGAEGARTGPAIMAGGSRTVWDRVAPILTAIAARHEGQSCADWLGPDGAGHFVKTVHNGIEYADMQVIAEVYGILRDGLGLDAERTGQVFQGWNEGRLASYLIEITAEVARTIDPTTGGPLLDVIADSAGQKGTGRWSAIEAQRLGAVATTIEAAVSARNLSADHAARAALSAQATAVTVEFPSPAILRDALLAARIVAYSQGFDLLACASAEYGWSLERDRVARVWRAGCIISAALLDDMATAIAARPEANLMATPTFHALLVEALPGLRATVVAATAAGLPVPALAAALAHVDQLSRPRGTTNLIQGLRDRFGQHGFRRIDQDGDGHHGPWR